MKKIRIQRTFRRQVRFGVEFRYASGWRTPSRKKRTCNQAAEKAVIYLQARRVKRPRILAGSFLYSAPGARYSPVFPSGAIVGRAAGQERAPSLKPFADATRRAARRRNISLQEPDARPPDGAPVAGERRPESRDGFTDPEAPDLWGGPADRIVVFWKGRSPAAGAGAAGAGGRCGRFRRAPKPPDHFAARAGL